MSERLAARTADAEALLARFGEVTSHALDALARDDGPALTAALDARDALRPALERAGREIAQLRARFGDAVGSAASRAAVERLVAPLETVGRRAEALQRELETHANTARRGLTAELSALTTSEEATSEYLRHAELAPRLDVRL